MLCYRCGSHVPDNSESCATCGLKLTGTPPAGAVRRRPGGNVEAPYKPGEVFARRYAIREVLGPGPVGHVFRALDQEMDVEVALKVINPRLVQMPEERTQFSLALRAAKKLTNPHHVRVYEEGEDKNRPFFTTQLLGGMTLRRMMEQRMAQGQRFTPKEVEPLLAQLVDALDGAHKYGPHSDLKPENIVVLPDLLKVTDHGLGLGIPRLPFLQAQKGWRVGSYVAPEYAEGGELDTRMDIYSLGVIVGELLTGQTPDEGEVPELLAYDPELPPGLESLYRRATNANPLVRPRTAGEFLAEYTAALSRPRPPTAKPATGAQAPVPPRPRPKPVPISLTAQLATVSNLGSDLPLPPVPTLELPSLAAPTVQVPVVGGSDTQEDLQATTPEAPRATTLEVPVSGTPTLEMPQAGGTPTELLTTESIEQRAAAKAKEEAPLPDATQRLDPASLAAIMGTAKAASGPGAKARPAPAPAARTEPRPAPPPPSPSRPAAPRNAPAAAAASRSPVGLVLLTLAGLGLGVAGGYALLWTLRQPAETPPATQAGKSPEGAQGSGQPSVVGPQGTSPSGQVAPAGVCPEGMRLVTGGERVVAFCIDAYEFPNQAGVAARVNVTWPEAKEACEKPGKRLCTEEEWEKACTSGQGIGELPGDVAEWTATPYDKSDMTYKGGSFDRSDSPASCASRKGAPPAKRLPGVGFRCCAGVKP